MLPYLLQLAANSFFSSRSTARSSMPSVLIATPCASSLVFLAAKLNADLMVHCLAPLL